MGGSIKILQIPVRLNGIMDGPDFPLAYAAICAMMLLPVLCNRVLLVGLGGDDDDVTPPRLQKVPQRKTKHGKSLPHLMNRYNVRKVA